MAVNLESLLREALPPVEPPSADQILDDLQTRLALWAETAQEELDAWELSSMRDPRNWARPAAAMAVTATAGSALVALRVRQNHAARVRASASLGELMEKTLADVVEETKRVLP
jgi:hypothetical protein